MYGASTYYAKITTVRVHYEPFYQDHLIDDVPRRLATVLSDGNTSLNTSTLTYNYSQFNVSYCENFFDSYGINLTSLSLFLPSFKFLSSKYTLGQLGSIKCFNLQYIFLYLGEDQYIFFN